MDHHGDAAPNRTAIEEEQQRVILEESEERKVDRDAAPDTHLEHRRSEETVEPVE